MIAVLPMRRISITSCLVGKKMEEGKKVMRGKQKRGGNEGIIFPFLSLVKDMDNERNKSLE